MTRLVVADEAEADVADILRYLRSNAGANVAELYRVQFLDLFERLTAFPNSGSPRDEVAVGLRTAFLYPYVVFHEVDRDESTLTILRVLHGRMDTEGKL
jgi:plasmid stabilization system protein ParE